MSAQDKTEQVLRELHIMLSKGETYPGDASKVVVDKIAVLSLLKRLNVCIYEIMDEHELTKQSRDAAEREVRRRSDEIVQDASRKAEDVYAASVMYTDEALHRVQDIMQETMDSVKQMYERMNKSLQEEKETVRRDQSELKGHLQNLSDSDKYLKLIEERNRELKKEKEKEKEEQEPPVYASVKPEIKINAEYFEKAGISLEEPEEEIPEEKPEVVIPEVNVNLDAEYFKWKDANDGDSETEKKQEKHVLFGKMRK